MQEKNEAQNKMEVIKRMQVKGGKNTSLQKYEERVKGGGINVEIVN